MKIAAAQIDCVLGDVEANLAKMREFAGRAKDAGAELILFPELADTGYSMPVIRRAASTWEEGAVSQLQATARDLSLAIVSGVSERVGESIYNSQVFIDADGRVIASYRKAHLFCGGSTDERDCFQAGDKLVALSWHDWRIGLSVCYDLRFPELYRRLAVADHTNVFLLSSAWPFPRLDHLRTLTLARAIENQSYLISANRVGRDEGLIFCGSSAIIDPYGVVLAGASADREELVLADLSRSVINSVRDRMKVFADRRQEIY